MANCVYHIASEADIRIPALNCWLQRLAEEDPSPLAVAARLEEDEDAEDAEDPERDAGPAAEDRRSSCFPDQDLDHPTLGESPTREPPPKRARQHSSAAFSVWDVPDFRLNLGREVTLGYTREWADQSV